MKRIKNDDTFQNLITKYGLQTAMGDNGAAYLELVEYTQTYIDKTVGKAVVETSKLYNEMWDDKDRLVHEMDVIMNGEDGAAKQASLVDIVSQLKKEWSNRVPKLTIIRTLDEIELDFAMTAPQRILLRSIREGLDLA